MTQSRAFARASTSVPPSVSASGIPGQRTSHQPLFRRSSVYRDPNDTDRTSCFSMPPAGSGAGRDVGAGEVVADEQQRLADGKPR